MNFWRFLPNSATNLKNYSRSRHFDLNYFQIELSSKPDSEFIARIIPEFENQARIILKFEIRNLLKNREIDFGMWLAIK